MTSPIEPRRQIARRRLELLADAELRTTIHVYRAPLAGRVTGRKVWQRLRAANRVGVTRGTLEERRNAFAMLWYRAISVRVTD